MNDDPNINSDLEDDAEYLSKNEEFISRQNEADVLLNIQKIIFKHFSKRAGKMQTLVMNKV